ncbi:MAG: sensor histidine kinase [Xanthobacteraceae bacterium]
MTLRHRLSLLVAIALIPPLLLTLYNVVRSQIVLDKEARGEALTAARLISAEFAQLIEGSRRLMVAMSRHPAIPDDEAACAAYFRSVIADIPLYREAVIIDTSGASHCATGATPATSDVKDRAYFREPMTTGRLTVGPLTRDGVAQVPSLHVSMPYRAVDGAVKGVMVLVLNPERIAQGLAVRPLRPHQRIMVLDRAGSLVLAVPPESAEGAKVIAQDVFPRVASASPEAISAKGLTGRPEIVGFVPVDNVPRSLFVAVAIDQDTALADARRVNEQSLAFALVTMLLAIAGAWIATHVLIDLPIRAIVETARRREAGDIAPFPPLSSSAEFGQLSTALARMSDKIHDLLEQKGFLLRELQHRVMNSLTLLSSVLDLQRRHVDSADAREHLERARDRVVAMATVYRYLYQTNTSEDVEFSGFLKVICEESQNAYAGVHKPIITVEAERLELSGSHAISLAMLTHELITNALKHAYPDGQPGPIDVSLKHSGTDTVELRVADQGRGMPEDFQIEQSSSLGMRVIATTVRQLRGTLEINRLEPGTEFVIRLPLDMLDAKRR